MDETSDRRGFLRGLALRAARGAHEAASVVGPAGLRPLLSGIAPAPAEVEDEAAALPEAAEPARPPAAPALRCATLEELLVYAEAEGLTGRRDAVAALARPSVRLTPAGPDDDVDAWLGGTDVVLDEPPSWGGGLLTHLAQIDLGAPALAGLPLAGAGQLLLFWDTVRAPSGLQPGAEEAARAVVVEVPQFPPDGGEPMRLTAELTLPRVWSAPVQALGLDDDEHEGYVRLRRRLAEVQGVETEDGAGAAVAYHRLFGYPNETTGTMPAACELTDRGLDADAPGLDAEVDAAAGRWQLLAQLSLGASGRVYFWIDADDLAAGDLTRIRVIPR